MIPLIVVTLIIGIILGQFVGGAFRAACIVGGVIIILGFISTRFDVDAFGWIEGGIKHGVQLIDGDEPVRVELPLKPGIREARYRRM